MAEQFTTVGIATAAEKRKNEEELLVKTTKKKGKSVAAVPKVK